MLRIVTDGAVDLPAGWSEKYGIAVLPLRISIGDQNLLQFKDLTSKNFYRIVKEKQVFPRTSLPSPEEMMRFYRQIAEKGDAILSIHVTSKLSGTFSVAQMVAKEMAGEFDIYPFDSGAGSVAQGIMCREARKMSQRGLKIEEILTHLTELRSKVMIYFTVENLEFARLSGRISALQTILSSLLKVNPILYLKDGLIKVGRKVRTRKRALDTIVQEILQRVEGQKVELAVVHADTPDTAQYLVDRLISVLPAIGETIMTELSVAIAAHLGPGAVGIIAIPSGEVN